MNRKGLSLVSFLVFVLIGFMILGSLYYILHKGVSLQDSTSKAIDMMIQARAVLENLRHDVEGAILFLPSEAQPANVKELIIIRDAADVAVERFNLPANSPANTSYPFQIGTGDTEHQMPVIQVKYTYNSDERTVVRLKEFGVLRYGDDSALKGIVCKYEFQALSEPAPVTKLIGSDITRFDFSHVTMDRAGKPILISELEPADLYLEDWEGFQAYLAHSQAALIFVHLTARFDKGLYGMDPDPENRGNSRKDRKAEEVDIVTKFVSRKCVADVVEREWFSSVDIDLKY